MSLADVGCYCTSRIVEHRVTSKKEVCDMRHPDVQSQGSVHVVADIGGTLTDLAMCDDNRNEYQVVKAPSTPPDYSQGVTSALKQILLK